jgi:hypothetical protein
LRENCYKIPDTAEYATETDLASFLAVYFGSCYTQLLQYRPNDFEKSCKKFTQYQEKKSEKNSTIARNYHKLLTLLQILPICSMQASQSSYESSTIN